MGENVRFLSTQGIFSILQILCAIKLFLWGKEKFLIWRENNIVNGVVKGKNTKRRWGRKLMWFLWSKMSSFFYTFAVERSSFDTLWQLFSLIYKLSCQRNFEAKMFRWLLSRIVNVSVNVSNIASQFHFIEKYFFKVAIIRPVPAFATKLAKRKFTYSREGKKSTQEVYLS